MNKTVYVGNIPDQATEEEVIALFAPYGTVLTTGKEAPYFPKRDGSDTRKGFAFITLDADEAMAAITGLANTELNGVKLTINEARPKA